jgi:hypothetical protein
MKIKTAELTGAALNWAVAMCEGWKWTTARDHTGNYPWLVKVGRDMNPKHYHPSTHWGIGGPIIEREWIDVVKPVNSVCWVATMHYQNDDDERTQTSEEQGETPLIAAMRCYVASKMGDEVEIPEEVTL